MDLILRNASLVDGRRNQDIGIIGDRFVAIEPHLAASAPRELDLRGCLASAPFVDAHFHMDATLSLGIPRLNRSGTLLEGIALWSELKPLLTTEAVIERALAYCNWAIAKGLLAIRSHVDICDPRLLAVEALLEVRNRMRPYLDLQLVAFPQDGFLRSGNTTTLLERALDLGVDVVGGIPHFERTMTDGATSIRLLCEIAERRGLPVDMHCDESDDPMSRHVEVLAAETLRFGLQGRVTGSHLTSMHSMDNYYVSKLLDLMVEARLNVVANPLINVVLQGRHDNYPKRRGVTRVKEQMARGLTVAFGHDCVMDPWYPLGSADMLEVAHMGLHIAQLTSLDEIASCYRAVTDNAAKILGLEGYGLAPQCYADLVVLEASDLFEAIRLRPSRLYVIRRGKVIAESPPTGTKLMMSDQHALVDFRRVRSD